MRMEDGSIFLQEVTEKIKERIAQTEETLAAGQKEIENMHDYYWENYTEMDQYGYEDFDNRQALLQQENANREARLLYRRFQRMLESPFFGRVDFQYDGDDDAEIFYIGIGNFAEKTGSVPLIYDWRAPVSSLFYDYDGGPASYLAPAGQMDGLIKSKWQYKVKHGKMVYAFESDMKIDDEILKRELGENGDVRLKNIVQTIQREQNSIIRNTKDKILVVQGSAGSGKTSVALHRIAYLLYHDRKHLNSSNILILSPNGVFSDYISHILPELGEENIREMSFDLFAYRELQDTAADCEDRYHHLERQLKQLDACGRDRYEWKQSASYIAETEGYLVELEEELMEIRGVSLRNWQKSEHEIVELFYYKFQDTPLLMRMDAVMEYVVDEYETLRDRSISEEDQFSLKEQFDRMYVTRDIYRIYSDFMERLGYPALPDVPPEKRIIEYEDVFPMLYLKYRLTGRAKQQKIKHLVIDEMQDYSYLQYTILSYLFSCRMTILGDRAQTMEEKQQDVWKFLPKIFGRDIKKIELKKSYRNTAEIGRYAGALIGIREPELLERHGSAVEEISFSKMEEAADLVAHYAEHDLKKYETIAVLTRTEEQAQNIDMLLRKRDLEPSYIDRDSSAFQTGITVTTFYLAKGLEFDKVYAVRGMEDGGIYRQADYICATRALHELVMVRISEEKI